MNIIICSFPWKLWEIFWRSQIIIIPQILRQTLFYNDALIVPVWISIFCKPFINFQQVFFERPPAEIERPCPVARVHMVARLFIDRFSINQIKNLVWVKRKEHMCQNMTRASSKKTPCLLVAKAKIRHATPRVCSYISMRVRVCFGHFQP